VLRESLNDMEISIVQSYARPALNSYFHSDCERGKILRKAEKFSRDVSHVARDSIARRKHSKWLRAQSAL